MPNESPRINLPLFFDVHMRVEGRALEACVFQIIKSLANINDAD